MKTKKKLNRTNPVARASRRVNKSHTFIDRKKESKKNPDNNTEQELDKQ